MISNCTFSGNVGYDSDEFINYIQDQGKKLNNKLYFRLANPNIH